MKPTRTPARTRPVTANAHGSIRLNKSVTYGVVEAIRVVAVGMGISLFAFSSKDLLKPFR